MPQDRQPTVDFDHHSPDFGDDQPASFAALRAGCPVGFSAHHDGFWVASTYETARQVVSDADNFTVEKSADGTRGGKLIPTSAHAPSIIPGVIDGEAHDRLRRPLKAAFSRAAVEKRAAPVVRAIAEALADELGAREEFDFAQDFSFELTVRTIFDLVGLDEVGDKRTFILMLEDAFAIDPEAGGDRDVLASSVSRQFDEASDQVRRVVRARAAEPRDDLISLMADTASGLGEDEVVSLALSMVLGGVRTTASSLDHMIVWLDEHPDLRAQLRADPGLIPHAVDELTRLATVTPLVARTAVEDTVVGEVTVRAGDRIAALLASANLDDDRFPDAGSVKLDRRDGLHLAFGAGSHYCLGIWLAKMELRVALETLLARLPDLHVVRDAVQRYRLVGVNNGFTRLPVRPHG